MSRLFGPILELKKHAKIGHDFGMRFYDLPPLQSDFKDLFGDFGGIWHTCFLPRSPQGGSPFARGWIIQRPQDCNGEIQHAVGQRPGEFLPASTLKSAITQVTPSRPHTRFLSTYCLGSTRRYHFNVFFMIFYIKITKIYQTIVKNIDFSIKS